MPRTNVDPRVDAYIEALPSWQQAICRQVRALVHAADPEVVETIKRTRQPYFTLEGNGVCPFWRRRSGSMCFCTTVESCRILTASSPVVTTTRPPARWRFRRGEKVNAVALKAML